MLDPGRVGPHCPGPRQRIVATIGKLPGLDREDWIGWDEIGRILSGKTQAYAWPVR
jgi:hypothetical protein